MKSVIFDMDGVLINSSIVYAKIIRNAFAKRSYTFSTDFILGHIIAHIADWVNELLPADMNGRDKILNAIVEDVKEGTNKASAKVRYQKDIRKILERAGKEKALFLITNSGSKLTEGVLKRKNLKRFFKEIITSDDGFGTKENAIRHIIKKYKLSKKDVVYVGDTERDVLCAKKVGCKAIILYTPFSWNYGRYEKIKAAGPDAIVKKADDLVKILQEG